MTRVAAVQMTSGPDVVDNLEEAARLITRAAARGARLVALPENFALMGRAPGDQVAAREPFGEGPIQSFLSGAARRHGIWLVGGSVPLAAGVPDKVRQSCLVYDEQGELAARYDKMHLFQLELGSERHDEARSIEAGSEVVVVQTPCGRTGLSICYDLRFPELYRAMGDVDAILVPSAFTAVTGRAHWEVLLRARAVENLAWVIAPAQGGRHPGGRETWGHAMIVDPWGVVLDRVDEGPGLALADLDPEHAARLRAGLPALSHRRIRSC